MRKFYYVNTGHRVGLDQFRRASALMEELPDEDITFLTNDFRIAGIAKQYSFKRGVGLDVIRNIPNIAVHGDKIIFDSNEYNDLILKDMKEFFSTFIMFRDEVEGDDENSLYALRDGIVVSRRYEEKVEKTDEVLMFFGDDDYEEDLLALAEKSELKGVNLLMGYYFFLDYEDKLKEHFNAIYEEDEYENAIKKAELVITSSYQTALEATLSGAKVVYMQRNDYPQAYSDVLSKLGIFVAPMKKITEADIQKYKSEIKPITLDNNVTKISQNIKSLLV